MKTGHPSKEDHISDDDFVALWFANGCSPTAVSRARQCHERSVYSRASSLRAKGFDLPTASQNPGMLRERWTYPREHRIQVDGVVMMASDLHIWPATHQARPVIQEVFAELAHKLKPSTIILAGDLIDATRISRHPSLRGQNAPKVGDEAAAMEDYVRTLPKAERRHITPGNHDFRVDAYLANHAPEMEDWSGRLFDRLPGWDVSYSVTINEQLEVMHNWHGGIHGAYNNAMRAGISMATGHTHQLECKPVRNRRGVQYGVELGMLNDPMGPQFEYAQNRPSRAAAGFGVFSFDDDGRLMPPEMCVMDEGRAIWRGQVLNKPRFRVRALGVAA